MLLGACDSDGSCHDCDWLVRWSRQRAVSSHGHARQPRMSVAMTNCGAFGWSPAAGYRCDAWMPEERRSWLGCPRLRASRGGRGRVRGLPGFDAGLLPHQPLRARRAKLTLHQDRNEKRLRRAHRLALARLARNISLRCPVPPRAAPARPPGEWRCGRGAVHPGLPITHRRARRRKPSADRTQSAEPDVSQGVGVRFERGRAAERMSFRRFWPIGAANRAEWR